tara:strand:- start:419 stop:643 length:225 start_codon:yes stop_codon:yes gene_type:complete
MGGLIHPFTGMLYEKDADGNVLVSNSEISGLFAPDGRWINGDLRECDPQLCNWVAGPIMPNHRIDQIYDVEENS